MDAPIARNSLCLGGLPVRHARYRPHHTAVVVPAERTPTLADAASLPPQRAEFAPRGGPAEQTHEIRLDWREFNAYVNRWANALTRLGVSHGDRVARVIGNGLPLLATYWACAKLGAVIVPLSPLLTVTGLRSLLGDAPPKAIISSSAHRAALLDVRDALAPSTAWVLTDADDSGGFLAYGALLAESTDDEPRAAVDSGDLLTLRQRGHQCATPRSGFS